MEVLHGRFGVFHRVPEDSDRPKWKSTHVFILASILLLFCYLVKLLCHRFLSRSEGQASDREVEAMEMDELEPAFMEVVVGNLDVSLEELWDIAPNEPVEELDMDVDDVIISEFEPPQLLCSSAPIRHRSLTDSIVMYSCRKQKTIRSRATTNSSSRTL